MGRSLLRTFLASDIPSVTGMECTTDAGGAPPIEMKLFFSGADEYLCPNPRVFIMNDQGRRCQIPGYRLPFADIVIESPTPADAAFFDNHQVLIGLTAAAVDTSEASISDIHDIIIRPDHQT